MNASTRLGLLVASAAVSVTLSTGCGTWEEPDPPSPEPEQVSVVEPAPNCPSPGIKLRRDPGCW